MEKKQRLAKLALIVLLPALALAGCNFIGGIFDPMIGTWSGGVQGVALTLQINADKTFTEVMIIPGSYEEWMISGQWTYDSTAKTMKSVISKFTINGTDKPLATIPGIGADNSSTCSFEVKGDVATISGGNMPAGETYTLLRV
jgi:hypothetical protein